MNSRQKLGLIGLLWLDLSGSAFAQAAPRNLSERDVVAAAVAQNPTLHVALLRASQDRYALLAEQALYTPIFSASTGYTHTRTPSLYDVPASAGLEARHETRVGSSDVFELGAGLTKPFSFGTVVSASLLGQRSLRSSSLDSSMTGSARGPGYSLVGQLAVSQPLLRGAGQDVGLASLRQARLQLSATELNARQVASTLLSQVIGAYWELWYAAEVVRINAASQELARAQQEQATQQVQSGALAPASALPYATQVAELEEAALSARTEVRRRELLLAQLLGEAGDVGSGLLAGDSPELPSADEPAIGSATSEALSSSYTRKQLQAQLALVRDQLKVSGDPLRPRLDLDAYVQAEGLGNRSVPPAFEQFGRMEAVSAHVGLTFETPLSDDRRSAQIQQAQLSAHVTEQQIREHELAIRSSVATAIAQRRAARERVELSTRTETVARAQAEAERARFQAGGSIALAVQEAEDSLRQAQLRAQRARVDLVLADLALAELRGQLLSRYAGAIQQLSPRQRSTLTSTHNSF
ncbi:MAG TPA: TolC family protein [Polyangiaceae bacterium]|nr:TolC family protein [Polyangiaceae bacterium]